MTLVDDSIQPEQPKPKCQGNWCGHDAFAYIEANNVVVLLCNECITKVADACLVLGIQWKVFDPREGPLMPKDADTEARYEKDGEDHMRLVRARKQIYNGGSFELDPHTEQAAIACCDCGLVHILDLKLLDYARTVRVTLKRDASLTDLWREFRNAQQRGTAAAPGAEEGAGAGAQPGLSAVEESQGDAGGQAGRSVGGALADRVEDSDKLDRD